MTPVKIEMDDYGMFYIIPITEFEEFKVLFDEVYDGIGQAENNNFDIFEEKYSKYRFENLSDYQLFISQDELKRLTDE